MAEVEVVSLKEALLKQCIIMKKLYDELEEERDSSATAASEALSMILRLEREKAAEKMEACQYKRITEEKMQHVEESLAVLEELMQQKDMEISFLKHQLQACQNKLSSIGVDIPGTPEMRIYRIPSLGSTSFQGCIRRNTSLPSLQLDQLWDEMGPTDGDNPLAEEVTKKVKVTMKAKHNKVEVGYGSDPANKELQSSSAGNEPTYLEEESSSGSWHSAISSYRSYDSATAGLGTKLVGEVVSCLPSQAENSENIPECYVPALGRKKKSKMSDLIPQEAIDCLFNDDNWLNMQFMNTHSGIKLPKTRKGPFGNHANKLPKPKKQETISYNWTATTPQIDVDRHRLRLQKLEDGRFMKQEDSGTGKEHFRLLQEIYKQLESIEAQTKDSSRKLPPQDESSLVSVMEAVLSFSI